MGVEAVSYTHLEVYKRQLVEEGILYKKRGLGMFVKTGAVKKVAAKHKQQFYEGYVAALIREARKLHLEKQDILDMIERGFEQP